MQEFDEKRRQMVERDVVGRRIDDPHVLQAMREVPRHRFLPPALAEFAYQDTPLPIGEGQTISQPYVVALMLQAAKVQPGARMLEVGTGSGYSAAVASRIAAHVDTIERHPSLAEQARRTLEEVGYQNVEVRVGDGTLGWPDHAPYDVIVVTAGAPSIPRALLDQLADGGRLVIPIGSPEAQTLIRVTRVRGGQFYREDLGDVRFVPLVGAAGWGAQRVSAPAREGPGSKDAIAALIRDCAEPLPDIDAVDLAPLLDRIGEARVVVLGEATHGTSEFYRMRSRITRELVLRRGFNLVALEADWPDATWVDRYVRDLPHPAEPSRPFRQFPTWMWGNAEFQEFIEWLRAFNAEARTPERRVGVQGLDLYSLFRSVAAVLDHLDQVDPEAARIARERYGSLTPWQTDPAAYGRAAVTGSYGRYEQEVVQRLEDLFARRVEEAERQGERLFDAHQSARLVANAERYYRVMYFGARESWSLRDRHMFETLQRLLAAGGPDAKVVVWAHNAHVGDAAGTEIGRRGELNLGMLCRRQLGDAVYLVGFGTDHGTVAAASEWAGPLELKSVRPAHPLSYEHLCHHATIPAYLLPLRHPRREALREELLPTRLERAIGVVYRPETELQSHYFQACLPRQFDEYVWFDASSAVRPLLPLTPEATIPPTSPFGR